MPGTDQEWPTLSEELARKALSTLSAAMHRHSVEKILTDAELRLVVDTLVDTVQGLVPWEVSDTIYCVRKELEKA